MYRSISRFSRGALLAAALLGGTAGAVRCSSAERSPASFAGYIVSPADDGRACDVRWATYLAEHLSRRSDEGARMVRVVDDGRDLFRIVVRLDSLAVDDFEVERTRSGLTLAARTPEAMLWLLYQAIKRLGEEDARFATDDLPPATVCLRDTTGRFAFDFRSLYGPEALDADMGGILALDNVDTRWELWGHGLDRVLRGGGVGVQALVDGARYEGQWCLSSEETFRRIAQDIEDRFGTTTPGRFVIAPADDAAACCCPTCVAAGNTPRSATPSAAKLARRLAERFPGHRFFLLGYLSTVEPPREPLPRNVGVIVSAMELPLSAAASEGAPGKRFASRIEAWRKVVSTVYVWDYVQNFDDYLTPFPVEEVMRRRLVLYRRAGVEGVFLNGSGYDYVPFGDMRASVLAALLLSPDQSTEELMRRFFADRYPLAGGLLADFCTEAARRAAASTRPLPLYGSIVEAEAVWMEPEGFVRFYDALTDLLPKAAGEERRRLHRLVTALSFTRLEVARRHASDAWGCATRKGGRLVARPETRRWLDAAAEYLHFDEMRHLSEAGLDAGVYLEAWRRRILPPSEENLLAGLPLGAESALDEGYTDLGVLTDGVAGLAAGYHYGWIICSRDLRVSLPEGPTPRARRLVMTFLDLPRHRIRMPRCVEVYGDGVLLQSLEPVLLPAAPGQPGRIAQVDARIDLGGAGRVTLRAVRADGRSKIAADEIILKR